MEIATLKNLIILCDFIKFSSKPRISIKNSNNKNKTLPYSFYKNKYIFRINNKDLYKNQFVTRIYRYLTKNILRNKLYSNLIQVKWHLHYR